MTSEVCVERVGAIACLVIDRPASANSIRPETAVALEKALRELSAEVSVRVLQVRGAGGKAFCSGYDLSGVASGVRDGELQSMLRVLRSMPMATVAVLDGHAVGAGLDLASSCDLRIARLGSRIGLPAVRLGVAYDAEGLRRMIRLAPALRRILLTGELVGVEQVAGFADLVVPAKRLDDEVAALCDSLATASPSSLAYMAAMVRPDDGFDPASARRWRDQVLDGEDSDIGVRARADGAVPAFPDRTGKGQP